MQTLIDLVEKSAATYGHRPALVIHAGLRDDVWEYDRLWAAINSVARYLREEQGCAPGDRVLALGPNCPQLAACYLGAMLAQVTLVPIDPFSTPDFVGRIARQTNAKAIFVGTSMPLPSELTQLNIRDLPYDDGSTYDGRPSADDVAEVVFTSGTTGDPKGVVLTHANILSNIVAARSLVPPGPHYKSPEPLLSYRTSMLFSASLSFQRLHLGISHSIWMLLKGRPGGAMTSGLPAPRVAKAMFTPSAVFAYWTLGCVAELGSER